MSNKVESRFLRLAKHLPMLPILAIALALSLVSLPTYADELSDLKAMVKALTDRIDAMEAKQKAESEQQAADAQKAAAERKAAAEQRAVQESTTALGVEVLPGPLTKNQEGKLVDQTSNPVMLYTGHNSTLRLYGLIEPTLQTANHQNAAGDPVTGYQVSWFSGNRLGFDAMHLLTSKDDSMLNGVIVMAKLESEYELPTGNMDTKNVFFNRDAWAGFYSDQLGKLTFGRQNTLTRDFTQNWGDAYGTPDVTLKEGGYSNVNNFKQYIFYSASPDGTRYNSAIVWKKDWDGHWLTGLAYAFGSGGNGGSGDVGTGGSIPGDFTNGTAFAASVAYNHLKVGPGEFNLNGSYDRGNNSDLIHQSELFGGNYNAGWWRINAGYAHYTAQQGPSNAAGTRTDNSWTVSGSLFPFGPKTEFALGYIRFKGNHAGFNAGGVTLNPYGNTSGVTMTADGGKESTFGSIMYHWDNQLDLYVAADYFKVTGEWVIHDALGNGATFGAGQPYNSETELALGFRYKF